MVLSANAAAAVGLVLGDGVSDDSFIPDEASPSPQRLRDWSMELTAGRSGKDEVRDLVEQDLRREAFEQLGDLVVKLDSEEWMFDFPGYKRRPLGRKPVSSVLR